MNKDVLTGALFVGFLIFVMALTVIITTSIVTGGAANSCKVQGSVILNDVLYSCKAVEVK